MANLYSKSDFLFFVVMILFFNNIPMSAFSEKVSLISESDTIRTPHQYKSFRSVKLLEEGVPINDDNDDFMEMGSLLDAFQGPRRKRRGIQMESGFKPISYIYPESFSYPTPKSIEQTIPPLLNPTQNAAFEEEKFVSVRAAPQNLSQIEDNGYSPHFIQPEPRLEKYSNNFYLQQAMDNAWKMYGPKYTIRADGIPQELRYQPSNQNNFQDMDSEWDQHVTAVPIPVRNRVILQPGIFNKLLSRYIDFEVNNHEIADFARKVVFGFLVATLIVGWIGLGLYLGWIPFKWLLFTGRSEDAEGKVFERRSDLLAEITDRIFLALDSDWLKKLEERVKMNSDRKWIKTHVHCCILPQSQTKGMADCRVIRRERKLSPYKCLSDLLYSFQFGPSIDEGKDSSNEARSAITNSD